MMKRTGFAVMAALSISAFAAYSLAAQQQQGDDAGQGMHSGMMNESMQGMMQCPAMGNGMGMNMGNDMGMNMGMGNAMGMNMGMGNAMGMNMGMAMQGGGPASPDMLLRMAEPLGLTPEQITRLEALRDRSKATGDHMDQAMAAHQKAAALSAEPAALNAYEEALREAANHMVLAHVAMAQNAIEADGVLTPDQRSRLDTGMRMMQQMMGGDGMMGGGGMMNGSGMMEMHGMHRAPGGLPSR